jgi:integrase/recombinase XerD
MAESTTLYIRHRKQCPHKLDRNYRRCGCPVWFQRNRKRWSAETTDWAEALQKATAIENGEKAVAPSAITVEAAVDLYLKKRSGCQDASKAPYKDRWLLRDGSKRQQSLIAWAKEHNFIKLRSITAGALDQWRDTWVFRPNSFSQKVHCGVIAAFFEWAVTFEYLSRNPFDKLDKIRVKEVPTLPLEPEQVTALLAHTDACGKHSATMGVLILLMRWSGLAIRDASCLRRDALGADNRLRTYRKKTGEYVYVKLPTFVADALRSQTCSDPKYFFWDSRRRTAKSQAQKCDLRFQTIFNAAGITPCGAHRLRDTFAVEFLKAGGLIQDLAMLLGHSSTRTTERHYMPWNKSRQQRLDAAVDKALAAQGIVETPAPAGLPVQ